MTDQELNQALKDYREASQTPLIRDNNGEVENNFLLTGEGDSEIELNNDISSCTELEVEYNHPLETRVTGMELRLIEFSTSGLPNNKEQFTRNRKKLERKQPGPEHRPNKNPPSVVHLRSPKKTRSRGDSRGMNDNYHFKILSLVQFNFDRLTF